jgi:hypothetical protein
MTKIAESRAFSRFMEFEIKSSPVQALRRGLHTGGAAKMFERTIDITFRELQIQTHGSAVRDATNNSNFCTWVLSGGTSQGKEEGVVRVPRVCRDALAATDGEGGEISLTLSSPSLFHESIHSNKQ